jgi:hydrogenase/urease accessory protein HupE
VFEFTEVVAFLKSNGTYVIDLTVDVDALALGVSPTVDSAVLAERVRQLSPDELARCIAFAEETIRNRVRVRFNGLKENPSVSFPDYGTPLAATTNPPTVLGITARLTGRIPPGAVAFTFGASRSFNAVHLTILDQSAVRGVRYVLDVSEDSPPHPLGEGAAPTAQRGVAWRYLVLGFEHILPKGLDHILFVLGLFLLSTRLRPLVWQITAFTIAHSITLALAMLEIVSLPSKLVESMIALSIAYVAVENMVTSELKPWRPVVVFLFGLLHGLGFAGVLRDLGLPREEFVTALVTFNIGVEFGQLSVVLIALLAVGWFHRADWYRSRIVVPLSAGIALVGLYWCVERALG